MLAQSYFGREAVEHREESVTRGTLVRRITHYNLDAYVRFAFESRFGTRALLRRLAGYYMAAYRRKHAADPSSGYWEQAQARNIYRELAGPLNGETRLA